MSTTTDPSATVRALRKYPPLRPIIKAAGPPPPAKSLPAKDRYSYLVRSIVYQQLAGAAARAISGRLWDACGGTVTAAAIDSLDEDVLTTVGLSRSKRAAIRSLTTHVDDQTVRLDRHGRMTDGAIVEELVQVRGIGPWTAQMYLMFQLGRPDVWPILDFGVRNGWSLLHDLDEMITPKELAVAGSTLAPYRSAVAWYCWAAVDVHRGTTNDR